MSEEELKPSPPTHSIRDFISRCDLGIPHFQRGLVWSNENTALLLESLYFRTPCGTIVLWEPSEPDKEGVPLLEAEKEVGGPPDGRKLRFLIVDGQQRIRSLRNALGAFAQPPVYNAASDFAEDDEDGSDESERDAPPVWCLNLTRVPELEKFFQNDPMARYPMFRLIADPTRAKRAKHNLVLLGFFFGETAELPKRHDGSELIRPATGISEAELRSGIAKTRDKIGSLLDQKVFFLKILEKSALKEVVKLYNRINSAGKRVEPEEKGLRHARVAPPANEPMAQGPLRGCP
jgi:hypothetical protein